MFGSAFALQEQNASGLGQAYAGGAAGAEDVSTIWFNPAGLVRLQTTQAVIAGNLICPSAKLQNNGSQPAQFQSLGGTGGDAGGCEAVPNMYLGIPFADKWSFGLGVNVPFGLKTEYDSNWLRTLSGDQKSQLQAININPTLSWAPTQSLTVGAGVNWQRVKATLTSNVNYAGLFAQGVAGGVAAGQIPAAAAPTLIGSAAGLQSNALTYPGNDSAWGWNAGILWQATPANARIGAAYRSTITRSNIPSRDRQTLPIPRRWVTFRQRSRPVGAAIVNGVNSALYSGDITLDLKMPDTANASIFHTLNDQWDLMADLQYTGWSVLAAAAGQFAVPASCSRRRLRTSATRGAHRFGANYHVNDSWTVRGGVAVRSVAGARRTTLRRACRTTTERGLRARRAIQVHAELGARSVVRLHLRQGFEHQSERRQHGRQWTDRKRKSYKNNVNILGLQITYTAK